MNLEDIYFVVRDLYLHCEDYDINTFNVPVVFWDESTHQFKNVYLVNTVQNEWGDKDTYFVEIKIK